MNNFFFLIEYKLVYMVGLVPGVREMIQLYIYIYIFFQVLFSYRLLQNIEYYFPVLYSKSL